jgi:large subunit ribosomal protein L17
MRHRKAGVKLNRTSSHRKAMFRNMVTSLLKHEKIQTTDAKAKALRAWVDHIITLAKRGDLHARRQALAIVREKNVVHKLFAEAIEKFGGREGGYTRIIKLGRRPGDAAPVSMMELITSEEISTQKGVKKKETPVIAPKIADKEKETEAGKTPSDTIVSAADDKTSEKVDVSASEAVVENAGVEIGAPVQEELSRDIVSETKAIGEETGEVHQEPEKTLADEKNQEEKK